MFDSSKLLKYNTYYINRKYREIPDLLRQSTENTGLQKQTGYLRLSDLDCLDKYCFFFEKFITRFELIFIKIYYFHHQKQPYEKKSHKAWPNA